MPNTVVKIRERAKRTATELTDWLQNLTASVSERQIPAIITPSTNTTSASPNNTGAIESEPQPPAGITPRRLQYTTDEEALLLTDSEETMSVSTTYKQILALV